MQVATVAGYDDIMQDGETLEEYRFNSEKPSYINQLEKWSKFSMNFDNSYVKLNNMVYCTN